MPRLRDRAVVLVPQRSGSPSRIDWSLEPESIPAPFEGQQQRSGGGELDQGSALATWSAWLPPAVRVPNPDDAAAPVVHDLVERFHAGCRISWHGVEYSVDGPVRRPRRGGRIQWLAFTMKRSDKRPA